MKRLLGRIARGELDVQELHAATLAALQQTQSTLQASYTAAGRLSGLNLAAYLR
jgi:hypothetical protein